MTAAYQPAVGDTVTSPLLVGEWQVDRLTGYGDYVWIRQGQAQITVHPVDLRPMRPREPAVGAVVWAQGRYWHRGTDGVWHAAGEAMEIAAPWADIAADAEPVVPVSTVVQWLYDRDLDGTYMADVWGRFRAEFGVSK